MTGAHRDCVTDWWMAYPLPQQPPTPCQRQKLEDHHPGKLWSVGRFFSRQRRCMDLGGMLISICEGKLISSWWLNHPSEKYARQNGFIFPNFRGENKTYLKPPPRYFLNPKKIEVDGRWGVFRFKWGEHLRFQG